MMGLHACLYGSIVESIIEVSDEDHYSELIKLFTAVVLIQDEVVKPNVGWTLSGTTWIQGDAPRHSIKSVTPRQIRLALTRSGMPTASIDDFIANLPAPMNLEVKIWWEYSTEFFRDNPLLNQMAPMLNLSQQDLDDLFTLAATL